MAEGAGLLILCRGNLTEGSNPSDSDQHQSRLLRQQAAFVLWTGVCRLARMLACCRARAHAACCLLALACAPEPIPRTPVRDAPSDFADTEHLIRYACAGFEDAVAADAPRDRLLSHTAKHAVELGGAPVELASQRWALTPPQGLLEEIDAYERAGGDPKDCAGLRAHLERLASISASH